MQASPQPAPFASGAHPSKLELFTGFALVGLYGVGGIAAASYHVVVERRKWLTAEEYASVIALSQVAPGANLINMTTIVSDRFQGVLGAVAALGGLLAMPLAILLALTTIYDQFADLPDLQAATYAAAAGAVGLMAGTGYKLMQPIMRSPIAVGMALLTFVAIGFFQTPLFGTVLVLGPLSVLVMGWSARR